MLLNVYMKLHQLRLFPTLKCLGSFYDPFFLRHAALSLCLIAFTLFYLPVSAQENPQNPKQATATDPVEINQPIDFKTALKQGDLYYKDKSFSDAITQFMQAITYISGDKKTTQEQLAKVYIKIAKSYKQLKNGEKTSQYYKKALDAFMVLNNQKAIASTLNTIAQEERKLGNSVMAMDYSIRSLDIFKTLNFPKDYAKALMGAGIIYRQIELYEKSLNHVRQAYSYYQEIKDDNGIAKASNEMGHIYIRLRQFDEAKFFFQQTLNISEEKLKAKTLASAFKAMATINFHLNDYNLALEFAKKAYEKYMLKNDGLNQASTARVIANIYRAQQDSANAIKYYEKSFAIALDHKSKKHQIEAHIPLAEVLILLDTDKAINLLVPALEIAIEIKDDKQTYHAYHKLRRAEERRGNFEKALDYTKNEIIVGQRIQQQSDKNKINLAKATSYLHKVELELESLREKTKLDQLEIIKKNNEIELAKNTREINELKLAKKQYTSIALSLLLLACLFLVLFFYKHFIASKKRNRKLNYLASRDPLTNCYNRRSLFELMDKHFESADLEHDYSIIMVDIDHFKNVNDTYGHNAGDSVLRGFASVLQSNVRGSDIVARLGGEEFCIVLHHTHYKRAMSVAEKIRAIIEDSNFDDINVTSSFGVSSLTFEAPTPSALIEQADLALYKSKSLGRNQVTLWDESLSSGKEK